MLKTLNAFKLLGCLGAAALVTFMDLDMVDQRTDRAAGSYRRCPRRVRAACK